ncbi:hypothetical protein CEXT_73211 [Caerostris extrusa]|uniref:Uncharacterized protein n=1 Tax=Caerostris extrusa TaxID=172846 RepID=A0AAV4XHH6_CAEEX|nr:hypothetical protein CEXT_73211 [Caerostris extrusa]
MMALLPSRMLVKDPKIYLLILQFKLKRKRRRKVGCHSDCQTGTTFLESQINQPTQCVQNLLPLLPIRAALITAPDMNPNEKGRPTPFQWSP